MDARAVQRVETGAGRPDYGLDAPGAVRNLLLGGAAGLLLWLSVAAGFWSGRPAAGVPVAGIGLACFVTLTATALWMVYYSKVGKHRSRERLLNLLPWRGDERVLDVGCGKGLVLNAAARRLTRGGRAVGIDLWQAEDLTGNAPGATLANARREGVADRVEVGTADMRSLPFADASFDLVVSNVAIHNVYDPAGRAKAVAEIARVLKPGGRALLNDIRHAREYAATLRAQGCPDARLVNNRPAAWLATAFTWGSVRPGTVLATKTTS